jgi:hypothetical protein
MHDDETGDPERLIQFVKLCAKEFGLTGRWGFQYADTCSRPRVNAFGGAHVSTSPPAKRWPGPIPMAGSPTCSTEVIPMPEIIETTVYRLEELSDAAKDKARAWYRQVGFDHDWFEFVYDDFERICSILGIDLKTVPVRLYGGGTRQKPCIWFSGFWSQGDGACFEGRYRHAKGAAEDPRPCAEGQ